MADDKTVRGGQDRQRIDIHENYEVRDWARKLGVTPEALKAAVKAVGDRADEVEKHLRSGR